MKPSTELLLLSVFVSRVLAPTVHQHSGGIVELQMNANDTIASDRWTIDRSALVGLADTAAGVALGETAPPFASWRVRELSIQLLAPATHWVKATVDASAVSWSEDGQAELDIELTGHAGQAVARAVVKVDIAAPRH